MDIEKYINSLPDDIRYIDVSNSKLTYLPDLSRFTELRQLKCSNNNLTSLPALPPTIAVLFCYDNKITRLPPLPPDLYYLDCNNNLITTIPQPLPPDLDKLYCCNNLLTFLPNLHENIRVSRFFYYDNPIHDIIRYDTVWWPREYLHIKIRILNQFRILYYSMKFKTRFRDWLWIKIREPKIKHYYSPVKLIERIEGIEDDEQFHNSLDSW